MNLLLTLAACLGLVLLPLVMGLEMVKVMTMDEVIDMENTWTMWKDKHGKNYSPREEAMKRNTFFRNLAKIKEHNSKYPINVSFTMGLNQFSDMTVEEYRSYNKLRPVTNFTRGGATFLLPLSTVLPASVDWRDKGLVTPVKNQGQCGSCWAFSTTGSVEGQHARKTGTLLSLSEQQLVDCSQDQGNQGCNGGWMDSGFLYIMSEPGGLETEADYPYTATDGTCSSDPSLEQAPVKSYADIKPGSEAALMAAVATVGPVSVAIDASGNDFQNYNGGVYVAASCSSTELDHGVLVVGYGTQNGQDYWLVKNSWDVTWGMDGYIMMARNYHNMCGIATKASYPVV